MTKRYKSATTAVRAGVEHDTHHGAVMPPLHLSVNFSFAGYNEPREYDYTRSGNPTRDLLGKAISDLDGGAGAVITASGMAAVTLLLQLIEPGEKVLVPHDCYGGSYRLFTAWARKRHFELLVVDQTDPAALAEGLAAKPRLVWIETPSNPLLRITDIAKVTELAHAVGALVVVDNTFLSPALQRPLQYGADFVLYSTTKYLNGHSDVVGGALVSADPKRHEELDWWANCLGLTGAPFDSYLTLRGLRTLAARMRVHEENAAAVAQLLSRHPAVTKIHYPGLPDHPGHSLALRQQAGFGAMLGFELAGGEREIRAFLDGLDCFTLAESLGAVESLVAHPATMTHSSMDPEARRRAGISDSLLRLSVGIEAASDLLADLEAGLDRAAAASAAPRLAIPARTSSR
jgi:cystathionine gamma-synthase